MDQASELFKANEDHEILKHLKAAGGSGDQQRVAEMTVKFEEHMQQLEEVRTCICMYYVATELVMDYSFAFRFYAVVVR